MRKLLFVCNLLLWLCSLYSLDTNIMLSPNGQLRYYEAEKEGLFLSKNYSTIIRVTDGDFVEKKFDEKYRISQEVFWNKDSSFPSEIRNYTYDENIAHATQMKIDDYSSFQRTIELYNDKGFINEKIVYSLEKKDVDSDADASADVDSIEDTSNDDGEEGLVVENKDEIFFEIDEGKTKIVYRKKYVYDDKNRVIEETTVHEDLSIQHEKIIYAFNLGSEKADMFSYKGNDLKKSIVYSSPSNWVETSFFPNSFQIRVTYTDSFAVKEEVFQNGEKIRERDL